MLLLALHATIEIIYLETVFSTLLLITGIIILLSLSRISREPLRVLRRPIALSILETSFSLLSLLLGLFLGSKPSTILCSILTILLSFSLIVYGLAELYIAVTYVSALYLASIALGANIVYTSLVTGLVILFIILFSLLFREKISIAKAFVKAMLDDDYDNLERLILKHSIQRELPVKLTVIRTNKGCLILIIPKIHFGPFRLAFSSDLPYLIEQSIKRKVGEKARVLIFHSDVDHSYNLSSKYIARRLVELIAEETKWLCEKYSPQQRSMREAILETHFANCSDMRCFLLLTPMPIAIIDRPGKGIDDFVLKPAMSLVAIVDAHNEEETVPLTYRDITVLDSSLQNIINRKRNRISSGKCGIKYVEISVDEEERKQLGLCKNWIKVLEIECKNKTYIVLVPSNNALPGVREEFEKYIKEMNMDPDEKFVLITLDDHTCSGVVPGQPSYVLRNGKLLARMVSNAVSQPIEKEEVRGVIEEILMVNVKVWGKSIDWLKENASIGMKIAIIYLATWLILLVLGILASILPLG